MGTKPARRVTADRVGKAISQAVGEQEKSMAGRLTGTLDAFQQRYIIPLERITESQDEQIADLRRDLSDFRRDFLSFQLRQEARHAWAERPLWWRLLHREEKPL